jgi:hypothetical protein
VGSVAATIATRERHDGPPGLADFGRVGYVAVSATDVAVVKAKLGSTRARRAATVAVLGCAALAASAHAAVGAGARVAYIESTRKIEAIVVTNARGGHRHVLDSRSNLLSSFSGEGGEDVSISPDGASVAAVASVGAHGSGELLLFPTAGGKPRLLLRTGEIAELWWSGDSQRLVAETGPTPNTIDRLVVFDVRSGTAQTIATGDVDGIAFAPTGGDVVYGRGANLYIADTTKTAAAPARQITQFASGISAEPIWSAKGIVFSRSPTASRDVFQLWSATATGGPPRQLTHVAVSHPAPGFVGFIPVAASADGTRLVANLHDAEGLRHAWEIDLSGATPVARPLPGFRSGQQPADNGSSQGDDVAQGISRDGATVLIYRESTEQVQTAPWAGGSATLVAGHAEMASWNG